MNAALSDRIPKDLAGNLTFRKGLLERAKTSPSIRKALIEACERDVCFFISAFVYQYNGKEKMGRKVGPFIAWEFQEEAAREIVACVMEGRDLVIEKSRDMGASWLCLIVSLWLWLFHPWTTILIMSKSAIAVEDGSPESLFWKLDFIISHLPNWLMQGYQESTNRRKMIFTHPNGSTIYGTASTGKAGVGGKVAMMFVDEFSQIEEGYEVLHRTTDTTDCRVFNGTHLGTGTAFYELTDPQSAAGAFIKKLVMHWTQHPEKSRGLYRFDPESKRVDVLDKSHAFPEDFQFSHTATPAGGPFPGLRSPWYDDQCNRKGNARAVAMDLDIDPSGSVEQFFNAILIQHLIGAYACSPYWEADFQFDVDLGRPLRMEPRRGAPVRLWCHFHLGKPPLGRYVVAADVSQGTGATCSCVTVLNVETGDKVLEYADSNVDPKRLGSFCVALAWLFKDRADQGAMLGWEIPGPGMTMGAQVVELNYTHVYHRVSSDARYHGAKAPLPGWTSTSDNKLRLLNEYADALRTRKFLNRSREALQEALKFKFTTTGKVEHTAEHSKNHPSGARVNHGDHVIADALAWWLARDCYKPPAEKQQAAIPFLSMAWRRELRQKAEKEAEAW